MRYIYLLIKNLLVIVPVLVIVALMSLYERKIIGGVQRRKGPNVVGIFGLMQPIADAGKLFGKETIVPNVSNKVVFLFSPVSLMVLSIVSLSILPFGYAMVICDISTGILVLLVISSLGVYGVIMAGWSSNSKYAFLGGLRSAAQMIAYEVGIGIYLLLGCSLCNSLNLTTIVLTQYNVWLMVPLHMVCFLFFISALAETNRSPFDLPEAEAELVSGYNVEYSSMCFALFFIAEYCMILVMSIAVVLVYLGGWDGLEYVGLVIYGVKVVAIISAFVCVRAALPRCRYDQLMRLGWKVFLPLALGFIVLVSSILVYLNSSLFVGIGDDQVINKVIAEHLELVNVYESIAEELWGLFIIFKTCNIEVTPFCLQHPEYLSVIYDMSAEDMMTEFDTVLNNLYKLVVSDFSHVTDYRNALLYKEEYLNSFEFTKDDALMQINAGIFVENLCLNILMELKDAVNQGDFYSSSFLSNHLEYKGCFDLLASGTSDTTVVKHIILVTLHNSSSMNLECLETYLYMLFFELFKFTV